MFSFTFMFVLLQSLYTPPVLEPWIPWVTHGENHLACPVSYSDGNIRFCYMLEPLNLDLNEEGGNFSFKVTTFHKTRVALPNFEGGWPQSFQVNTRAFPIIDLDGMPYVMLDQGRYDLRGTFSWSQLPHTLSISNHFPNITLMLNRSRVEFPNRKEPGKIWLTDPKVEEKDQDHVFAQVFRLWQDGNPVVLTTKIQLSVAGKVQNWHFPIPIPQAFHLTGVETNLPFKINGDHLDLQLRPGEWIVTLEALSSEHLNEIAFPVQTSPWPDEEILSFESQPSIRQVEVQNLTSLDPNQLPVPEAWKRNPCYLLGSELKLLEKTRGLSGIQTPELLLHRSIWLDQDGEGFSFSDQLQGSLPKATFFSMTPPFVMGTASESNENLLITLDSNQQSGVEVRRNHFNLHLESRIPEYSGKFPATGLNTTIKDFYGTLHLPSGWQILFATGPVDFVQTWFSQWDLYDFFIFLLLCFSFARLWDKKTGFIATACLFLCYQESDLPPFFWVSLAILTALTVYLPKGKIQTSLNNLRKLNFLVLLFLVFSFSASHLRYAFYPHLKSESSYRRASISAKTMSYEQEAPMSPAPMEDGLIYGKMDEMVSQNAQQSIQQALPMRKVARYAQNEAIQTGFGLPSWTQGPDISFRASSPIRPDQTIRLFLMSPTIKMWVTFLQIGLLGILLRALWNLPTRKQAIIPESPPVLALLLFLVPFGSSGLNAQIPDATLLETLKQRLLEKPDCLPNCAQYQSLEINLKQDEVTMALTVHSLDEIAVPLPGSFGEWVPENVIAGGRIQPLFLAQDGKIWVSLGPGVQDIKLQGRVPRGTSFSISFPLIPHNLIVQADDWTYELPSETEKENSFIRFFKVSHETEAAMDDKEDKLAPFFTIQRHIVFDQQWSVQTTVNRLGDSQISLLLEIPLLEGEAVTSEGIQTKDGRILVQFPGHRNSLSWESALPITEKVKLSAMPQNWYAEEWMLLPTPNWQVSFSGLEPFSQFDSEGNWNPVWKPWPSEELVIEARRPEISPGKTSTISAATLNLHPGRYLSVGNLEVKIKTSKGGTKQWDLPENSRMKTLQVDGRDFPFNSLNPKIDIPLNPGEHNVAIAWEEDITLGIMYKSPRVALGEHSLNNQVDVHFPEDRWVFWVSGPDQGPVLLFWSHVFFFLLASFLITRIPWIPFKLYQVFLLSLGLDQIHIGMTFFIYFWLVLLAFKANRTPSSVAWRHNLTQVGLAFMTFCAALIFLESIRQGLLNSPQMGITGNDSYNGLFRWYLEQPEIPRVFILSLPLWFYRLSMLVWALWMARFLTSKAVWLWESFQKGSVWRTGHFKLKQPGRRRNTEDLDAAK